MRLFGLGQCGCIKDVNEIFPVQFFVLLTVPYLNYCYSSPHVILDFFVTYSVRIQI
jgi:hypothetical protein